MRSTNKQYSESVNAMLEYYASGHTVRETAAKFGVTRNQVNYYAKVRKITNGRTWRQGGQECNRLRHLGLIQSPKCFNVEKSRRAGEQFKARLTNQGFELLSEYEGKKGISTIKCLKCGSVYKRTTSHLMSDGAFCITCQKAEIKAQHAEAYKQKQLEQDKKRSERENKKAELELIRKERLKKVRVCKVCGNSYTIIDYMKSTGTKYERDSGFCSAFCRDKAKHDAQLRNNKKYRAQGKRLSENHYVRAIKLGLPAEKGITKKALLKRDGDRCAICSLPLQMDGDFRAPLYWSIDHIIPLAKGIVNGKGGHTWNNVQLAHRQCNSAKRDLIGKEWNNGNN